MSVKITGGHPFRVPPSASTTHIELWPRKCEPWPLLWGGSCLVWMVVLAAVVQAALWRGCPLPWPEPVLAVILLAIGTSGLCLGLITPSWSFEISGQRLVVRRRLLRSVVFAVAPLRELLSVELRAAPPPPGSHLRERTALLLRTESSLIWLTDDLPDRPACRRALQQLAVALVCPGGEVV